MYSPEFQAGETKIIGQAFTVKFVPKSDESAPKLQGNYVRLDTSNPLVNSCAASANGHSRLIRSQMAELSSSLSRFPTSTLYMVV